LGDSTDSDKWIEVNLANQQATAYENGQKIFEFLISSGTWDRTPTGTFKIWTKIKSQKMSGGSKENGTYYYLPNVPYIMFFYNDTAPKKIGYSFHGAYWHDNFGVPMSHGCINMKIDEAKMLFDWARVDTPVFIFGKYSPPST
jgi:lipoprotein-anchoring transpeptidase ErfK/SrfK